MRITHKIELPYDSRLDEIVLQIVKCGRCRFEAIAVYEESRRGSFGDESIDHRGYYVTESDLKAVKDKISQCPNPRNGKCRSDVHKQLGCKDKNGRRDGFSGIELGQCFELERSRGDSSEDLRMTLSGVGYTRCHSFSAANEDQVS